MTSIRKLPIFAAEIQIRQYEKDYFWISHRAAVVAGTVTGGVPAGCGAQLSVDSSIRPDSEDYRPDGEKHREGLAATSVGISTGYLSE